MQLPPTKSSYERGAGRTVAFLVSLISHVILLLVLACWVMVAGRASQGVTEVSFTGESPATLLEISPSTTTEPDSSDAANNVPISQQSEYELVSDEVAMPIGEVGSSAVAASLTSTSLKSAAGELDTRGLGRGASFFGTYAQGGKFVYVIDSSVSMKGDRWSLARRKLIESLSNLSSDQEFFVICFDVETSLMLNATPQTMEYKRVNEVVIERVNRWLRSRTLGPATMPAEALQLAMSMGPDAIFILSDGELQDDTLQMLQVMNVNVGSRKQIPIHAIHLISQQGMKTLMQLALDNSGTFKHVEK